MDSVTRSALARKALAGYAHGPMAPTIARSRALQGLKGSDAAVLVEGVSDQIAVETIALRHGLDLGATGVAVLPAGGAHQIVKLAIDLAPIMPVAGLCDAAEADLVMKGLTEADRLGLASTGAPRLTGFFVCRRDLEDELIRAAGVDNSLAVIESQGDLRSFQKLQLQPAWRERRVEDQLRRFLGSGARRKLRYARLLAGSIDLDRSPQPIEALLAYLRAE